MALETDLDSDSYDDLDVALQRFGVEGGIEAQLEGIASYGGVSFADDVRPLLGNPLVVGVPSGATASDTSAQVIAAIRVDDSGAAQNLIESRLGLEPRDDIAGASVFGPALPGGAEPGQVTASGPAVAIDGETVVVAQSQTALEAALEQHGADDRLTETEFDARLDRASGGGLLRATGNAPAALDALGVEQAESVPWVGALRTFAAVLDVDGRSLTVDATLDTDSVSARDLPLAEGAKSPDLLAQRASGANLDQSTTARFALDVVRASVPVAAYDDITHRIEEGLHGELTSLLDQFGGGLIARLPSGETVTRSEVTNAPDLARALDGLKSEVPRLANAVSVGGPVSDALQRARLLIPALPVPFGYFPSGSSVESVPGESDLYQLVPPKPPQPPEGAPFASPAIDARFVFGLVDGVYVTAPSLHAAREAAAAEPSGGDTPPGAYAFSIPVRASDFGLGPATGAGSGITLTTLRGGIEAATDGLVLRLEAAL